MKIVQKKERRDRSQKAIEILANILMGLFCVLIILPCMNLISQAVSRAEMSSEERCISGRPEYSLRQYNTFSAKPIFSWQ